jgi:hypothetical protein
MNTNHGCVLIVRRWLNATTFLAPPFQESRMEPVISMGAGHFTAKYVVTSWPMNLRLMGLIVKGTAVGHAVLDSKK